jgi:hypothetical protein
MNVSKEYFNIAIDVMNQIEATQSETIEKSIPNVCGLYCQ